MEALASRVTECERRILVLEKFREKDLELNSETKNDVGMAIAKIDDLISTVKELPDNINESLKKSLDLMEKEHEAISKDFIGLREDYSTLKSNTEKKFAELQELIDSRTVDKDSKNYNQIKTTIVTAIITGIISFILGLILKM